MDSYNWSKLNSKVIITIPTYNRSDMIGRAIESVLNQTFIDWILIVGDDGSNDNTGEIVKSYNDDRIIYCSRTDNEGLVYTFNEMLDWVIKTKCSYWSWLASDDRLLPHFLESHIEMMNTSLSDVTWSDFYTVYKNGTRKVVDMNICPTYISKIMLERVCVSLASICIKLDVLRSIFEKFGNFCSPKFKHMNDWDFLIKLTKVTKNFIYINKLLSEYYIHPKMGSSGIYFKKAYDNISEQFLKERNEMKEKCYIII